MARVRSSIKLAEKCRRLVRSFFWGEAFDILLQIKKLAKAGKSEIIINGTLKPVVKDLIIDEGFNVIELTTTTKIVWYDKENN
jgi:hypothetical protein